MTHPRGDKESSSFSENQQLMDETANFFTERNRELVKHPGSQDSTIKAQKQNAPIFSQYATP
jgi:hypothetical protein